MCGIAGFLSLEQGVFATRTIAQAMCDVIPHRGPDDQGFLVDGPLAMGMRRLSIIDLAGGQQPISNEDGTISVIQNGEIYNFQEIRQDLEKRGHRFKTNSDTEAIVHLYEEYGTDCAKHLRGMFAFAIWDAPRRRLVVARDRLGIKPVFYSTANGRLLFGSELQEPARGRARPHHRPAALHDYLSLTYVPAPATIFRAAKKLPAGPRADRRARRGTLRALLEPELRARRASASTASPRSSRRCARRSRTRCAATWCPTSRSACSCPAASTRRPWWRACASTTPAR